MNQTLAALPRSLSARQAGCLTAGRTNPFMRAYAQQVTDSKGKKQPSPYAHTLKLPKTGFPLRADAVNREKQFRERCTDQLYPWQLKNNPGPQFVLHDGPPYANGDLHIGHFMNKVLKDIVSRYQVMQGKRVLYFPGWDLHGLPIEHKALEALKGRDQESLDPMEIRTLARRFGLKAVDKQKKGFREWAVMGDWENPYLTLHPEYEANQLEIFKTMLAKGYIYRQNKPVYWSPSSRTALAEAELEYRDDHVSTSAYVKFPLNQESAQRLGVSGDVSALIWTTTPWTLPANSAIYVHPELDYVLIRILCENEPASALLVGKDRLEKISSLLPPESRVEVVREFKGADLDGLVYHSMLRGKDCKVMLADYVSAESGTGLVHSAPGHGKEDYEAGLANGLDVYSPVDDHGRFTSDAGAVLQGLEVLSDGTSKVIELLTEQGALMFKEKFVHSYPYDWRTKQPIIQRATPQWFANIKDLKQTAWESVKDVTIMPESGRRRLEAFVTGRSEWCISRQRVWGVPIPVLYNTRTGEPLMTVETIDHIISVFLANGGSDAWWRLPVEDFLLPEYRRNGETYVRGNDTMDVWFDSGSSWKLLEKRAEPRKGPYADVYLEGSDQHRGWFQSSLLTSNAVRGVAPYKTLVTHGFTLDEQGRKMSKSIGNTVAPSLVISGGKDKKKEPAYGVDLLRLLIGSTDYTQDVSFGPTVFSSFSDTIRKIRNTTRFMLGNLDGFTKDLAVPYEQLQPIDRYVLHELYHFKQRAKSAFDKHEFFRAMQALNNFTNTTLSAFYFDVCKDRLYADGMTDLSRRSVQTVLYKVLVNYTTTLAPVTCHLAEEIWEFFEPVRGSSTSGEFSVFQQKWDQTDAAWDDAALAEEWAGLKKVRSVANRAIESARQDKVIGSSLEAELDIYVALDSRLGKLLVKYADNLRQMSITSQVRIHDASQLADGSAKFVENDEVVFGGEAGKVTAVCQRSTLHKCPRCWNFHSTAPEALCQRCDDVVGNIQ